MICTEIRGGSGGQNSAIGATQNRPEQTQDITQDRPRTDPDDMIEIPTFAKSYLVSSLHTKPEICIQFVPCKPAETRAD